MRTPYFGKSPQNPDEAFLRRQVATDWIRQRGTSHIPDPPRGLIAQSAPRGVLVTWGLPAGDSSDISGWRVYSPDQLTPIGSVAGRGNRSFTVPATAGATPPTINIFVSSVNQLGNESGKVLVTGKASVEAGAPTQPGPPPGYTAGPGSDTSSGLGSINRDFGPQNRV